MAAPEVRLDRLRPAEIAAAMARAPVAWVPMGALEFHADHLPNGTDGITGQGLLVRAAERLGGVVLPWSYLTLGTLALPWSFRYEPPLVAEALRQTLIKRVCVEVEAEDIGLRAMGLCYLELNAALGTGLGTDWPVAVDHASTMETSWLSALEPSLVATDRLPEDPSATVLGVYGPNPRFTVDAERGAAQLDAAVALLADRAAAVLRGEDVDPFEDLRSFVERYWPERLVLTGRAGAVGTAVLELTNPGAVSRYLSGARLRLDGVDVPAAGLTLLNPTVGETGLPIAVADLGPERGFYVRRQQTAELQLPVAVDAGPHEVVLLVELAGVTEDRYSGTVHFR
ncbi:MAG: creatininase family protein [Candidatus Limnocylindrales bacterium]